MAVESVNMTAPRTRSDGGPTEVLYGVHAVLEALRAGRRQMAAVYLARRSGPELKPIEEQAGARGVPLQRISADELTRRCGSRQHQGVGAQVGPYPLQRLEAVAAAPRLPPDRRLLVILDNIVDPHNLGAVVRTALAVDAAAVIIPKDRAAGPTAAVSKASAGALEHADLIQVTNLANTLKALKQGGWWIYGLDPSAPRSIFDTDLDGPVAVVVGSEARGIRPLVKKHCDRRVFIPQAGPVGSLNASVAAAVLLYEVYRQRIRSAPTPGEKS